MNPVSLKAPSDQLLPRRAKHNAVLNITMATPNTHSANSNTQTQMSWGRRIWLFIGLVSFLCALSIFTESQFYAYTIGIHGTYAHIIYYFVGLTLSAAIQVLLIHPGCCTAFLENYKGCFILKSCGGYLVMFTVCFLSSGTRLQYLGLSSNGTAPNPAVAMAVAPYRSQAFSEIAGLLASSLLTVNALSIIVLLRPAEHNTIFEVAATLTMESAISLLYKYPYVSVAAAVFIMAMTLLKNFLCCDQVVKAYDDKADDKAAGKRPADDKAAGKRQVVKAYNDKADDKAAGKRPVVDTQ
nr:hypothetical protein CFP56_29816 [Quercus suber]